MSVNIKYEVFINRGMGTIPLTFRSLRADQVSFEISDAKRIGSVVGIVVTKITTEDVTNQFTEGDKG